MTRFAEALSARKDFVVTCELIPGRGHAGKSLENIAAFVDGIRGFPDVAAVSLTDNAGGNPALSADVVGAEVLARGLDAIVHFSCKDMNRNFIESRAYALQRTGINSLLVITGDYPISGHLGLAKPVFDMDAILALHYLHAMNAGLPLPGPRGPVPAPRTDFFLGAAVSPFKWREASGVMQYMKLEKKVKAGARFVITQLGFDSRKHAEALQYVRGVMKSDLPVLGSVYVLTAAAAEIMGRGEVPGCWVAPAMAAQLREEAKAEDKGKGARLERAARQLAILRGLGYAGAHLEGLGLKADDVRAIVERSRDLAGSWESAYAEMAWAPEEPFYYFEGGENRTPPAPGAAPRPRATPRRFIGSPRFWMLRGLHHMFFVPKTAGHRMMTALSRGISRRKGLAAAFNATEHLAKRVMLQCRSCDDCAAMEMYALCPESRCPKGMRNGPCGGSRVDERCEVFPDRFCIWHDAYWRAKSRNEVDRLSYVLPPRNWSLYETGSWFNFFLGKDHASHPIVLGDPAAAAPAGAPAPGPSAPPREGEKKT